MRPLGLGEPDGVANTITFLHSNGSNWIKGTNLIIDGSYTVNKQKNKMDILDYKQDDEKKILDLFHIVFKKEMTSSYWNWRFLNNPAKKIMIKLMWDKEELVGHYAVSPVIITQGNESILTGLSMTTMTHPNYLGKGIFTQLAESLYEDEYKKNSLKAIWGFPNNNSHYGFIKNLKWKDLEQIPSFTVSASNLKNSPTELIKIGSTFNNKHVESYNLLTRNYRNRVLKNKEYLDWRYIDNPVNSYTLFEYENNGVIYFAVTKIYHDTVKNAGEVDIIELNFPADKTLLLQLLNAIKNHYSNLNISKLNTWLPIIDPRHIVLESLGFSNSAPIIYSGIRVMDENYPNLYSTDDWFYSMGDSDVY